MELISAVIMVVLSFLVSSLPILLYIWFVWWLDHHDREPLALIALAFFWGAVASFIISLFLEGLFLLPFMSFSEALQDTVLFVVLAPIVEELSKSVILFALFFHKRFNRVLDGVVYGAVVGFGFAASENLLYYISTYFTEGVGIWAIVVILRTMFTSVGHALFTAIVGAGVALMKFPSQRWMRYVFPPLAILTAIVLHSISNLNVVFTGLYSLLFFLITCGIIVLGVLVVGIVMFIALHDESMCIRNQLVDEVRNGVVREGEYEILPSYLKRRSASFTILKNFGYGKYRLADKLLQKELDLAFAKDSWLNASSDSKGKDFLRKANELRSEIQKTRRELGEAAGLLRP